MPRAFVNERFNRQQLRRATKQATLMADTYYTHTPGQADRWFNAESLY